MKRILSWIFLFTLFIYVNGQTDVVVHDKLNIPSANAATLKFYSEIPVSAFTGSAQISIPIYTINLNYTNFPIFLSYNASGFKPDVHPSWVGLGWNLNVGGIITREVKSYRDELYNAGNVYGSRKNGLGFYYSYKILDNDAWNTVKDPMSKPTGDLSNFTYNDLDRAPDIFSFNFLGYSGKFFLNHKKEWKVQCDSPIKVIFDNQDLIVLDDRYTAEYPCFSKFTLVDEKGIRYVFGGANAVEYSVSMTPPEYDYYSEWTATSWLLKEIQMPDGQIITLNYERGPFQSSFSYATAPTLVYKRSSSADGMKASSYVYNGQLTHPVYIGGTASSVISGSVISPVYLTSISIPKHDLVISFNTSKSNDLTYAETTYTDRFFCHPNGSRPVDPKYLGFNPTLDIPYFTRNPQDKSKITASTFKERFIWLKLNEINFKYNNQDVQSLKFYYMENPEKRLRLDSLSFIYPGSNQKETYNFEYHPDLKYPYNQEYEYLSEYSDHWGYSNLKFLWDKNISAPKASIKDRAKFGVLSKIIYPTKGYTKFFYENHDCSQKIEYTHNALTALPKPTDNKYELVGGLRIKRIVNVDGFGGYTSKEYLYTKDYGNNERISSGIVRYLPLYLLGDNMFSSDGIHICYSHVIEKYEDGSFKAMTFSSEDYINRIGQTTSAIVDDTPVGGGAIWGGYIPHSARDFERGKLLDEYFCDSLGKIINSKHYFYSNINKTGSNFIRSVDPDWGRRFYTRENNNHGLVAYAQATTAYYYYTYQNKLTSIKELDYGPNPTLIYRYNSGQTSNTSLVKEQSLEYDNYGQLVSTIIPTSEGKQQKNTIKYAYTDNPASGILYEMVNKNMLSYPVEQKSFMNTLLLKGTAYTYNTFNGNILLSKIEDINRDNAKTLKYENTKYKNGRLIERQYNTGLMESYLWNINGNRLMAVVKNASIATLNSILSNYYINDGLLSSDYTSDLNTLRSGVNPDMHLSTYDYLLDGNLKQESTPNALNNYYEYDNNRRLETVKDHNGDVVTGFAYNYNNGQKAFNFYLSEDIEMSVQKICPTGYISEPSFLSFSIPAGESISRISQEDANNKARLKYEERYQLQAENSCQCIRYGSYIFQKITSITPRCDYDLQNAGIIYRGDNIEVTHISLVWKTIEVNDYYWYNNDSGGVVIGKIIGDRYPATIKYIEFKDQRRNKTGGIGNTWIISIDPTGTIRVRLKSYSIDEMPKVGEQISFAFTAPIFN